MNLQAVIFDLDGTLIDSMGIWEHVDSEYLGRRGIDPPHNLFEDIKAGNSFIEVAEYFKQKFNLPDSLETIMNEWTEMVRWHYENDIQLKPGVREFLKFLKEKNIKMGVGTSNSQILTKKVLKANKILHFFDILVIGCKEIKGKPFPDIFLKAASELGVNSENCLVIEDVFVGVQAAKSAGMKVFVIEDNPAKKAKKQTIKRADSYFHDFHEILQQVKKIINN